MPEMDGFEVLEKIKSSPESSQIPVIFLTADNEAETEQKCFDSGAVDFIAKPFVTAVMRSRISRTLELEDLRKSLANRLDEKIKEVSHIKSQSSKDALTELWNRAYTEEKVSEMLAKYLVKIFLEIPHKYLSALTGENSSNCLLAFLQMVKDMCYLFTKVLML